MKMLALTIIASLSLVSGEELSEGDSKLVEVATPAEHERILERLLSNAKAIKSQLDLFALEFDGRYPSKATAQELEKSAKSKQEVLGKLETEGSFLNQLKTSAILFGSTQFRYFTLSDDSKGKSMEDCFLEAEECRLCYVKNLTQMGNTDTPILLAPMVPGTLKFDPTVFGGKAIVICIGNSTRVFDIGPDGELLGEGEGLFLHSKLAWENEPVTPQRIEYPVPNPADKNTEK